MTIHLCRDFLTLASASCPGTNMYALGMFLTTCGGFLQVGETNFNLMSSSVMLGQGVSGSINGGFGSYVVALPTGSYVVSSADVNRILALTSPSYPLANSGLFRITNANTVFNTLTIDYRSSNTPPPDPNLIWSVFIDEVTFSRTWGSGSNGTGNYGSNSPNTSSLASASRIVLTSPDTTSWQVRMCLDSLHDVSGAVPSAFSIAPGFGSNGYGDFVAIDSGIAVGKLIHLHGAMWYDTTSSLYQGMTVGLSPASITSGTLWSRGQWRISMIVDNVSGTCGIVNENVSLATTGVNSGSGWCVFGRTQDETEVPKFSDLIDQTVAAQCLFVAGSSHAHSNLTWQSQFHVDNVMQVIGWSKYGYPVAGVLSLYSDISNPSNSHVRYLTSSADTPWVTETELLDVEVLLGTVDVVSASSSTTSLWPFQPRRVGRLPFFMQGRANYPTWTVTGDDNWYHTEDGVFMQWGGPVPTGNAVENAALATSGSIESQQGLEPLGAFLPGSDPPVPPTVPNVQDIDSTRFRKTYSYFRQVPVNVGMIKGGSNPAR